MNKQIEEAKEIIQKLLEKNAELKRKLEENNAEDENLAKDVLDTKFGKDAYKYYQDGENDSSKAIEIVVKITTSMIKEKK